MLRRSLTCHLDTDKCDEGHVTTKGVFEMRRSSRVLLASMIMAIPFATAACQIPVGPCVLTILEGPTNISCTFA